MINISYGYTNRKTEKHDVNDSESIYYTLANYGVDGDEAIEIGKWAKTAKEGETWDTGDPTLEICIGA